MPHLLDEKNVRMLTSHKIFSEAELKSRCEIMLDNYCKTVLIEANTMIDMAKNRNCSGSKVPMSLNWRIQQWQSKQ